MEWTEKDIKKLKELYPVTNTRELATLLKRTYKAVRSKAKVLQLKKSTVLYNRKRWTKAEIEILEREYPNGDIDKLCELFECDVKAIYSKAKCMGFKRSEEKLKALREMTTLNLTVNCKKTRFKKGQKSWNKGKKGYMGRNVTSFKKGNIPHNHRPLWSERTDADGYTYIKVRDVYKGQNFELKHRWVYEQHHGPIPDDIIIEFVDGDKTNFDISNLIAVTRQENIAKNRYKDIAIVKRHLKIKDPEMQEYVMENHADIIELKRNELKVHGKLREHAKKSKRTGR